jgi:hypothetical protein
MDRNFVPPVSIEKFAAYLDGNLSEEEMDSIDALVSSNPDMEELVSISDEIDEDVQMYLQDEFAYEADMTALEDSDFDIPNLDANITPQIENDDLKQRDVACAAEETNEIDDLSEYDKYDKNEEELLENDEKSEQQTESSTEVINDDNSQESSDFLLEDDFFNG